MDGFASKIQKKKNDYFEAKMLSSCNDHSFGGNLDAH